MREVVVVVVAVVVTSAEASLDITCTMGILENFC